VVTDTLKFELANTVSNNRHTLKGDSERLTSFLLFEDILGDGFEFSHRTLRIVNVELGRSVQLVTGYI